MNEIWLNGIAVIIFIIGLFFYKLNLRKIHYGKVVLICLGLVLIPLSSFINSYLPYFIQLILFAGFSQFAHEYFRGGLFRRRKELHEIYTSKRKEHKYAKEFLYPHLKELEKRRYELIKETDKLSSLKDELKEQARQIKEERKELEDAKKEVKNVHFEVLSEKEDKE
ncbi:MAG: hypothetical protein KKA65_03300 [Nanoarchaeota archaeon]|nr:hypothetical protein [Nanoarchaeota archaeon]MBU4352021.1 hypothetical protein [Nanoarchaeota archaeon]MBU4456504.1 hypothetical protein [Nanoarchaeota archaeon]MCG2719320.1 hypothetical protein [Nanoarchaeota archaeon]